MLPVVGVVFGAVLCVCAGGLVVVSVGCAALARLLLSVVSSVFSVSVDCSWVVLVLILVERHLLVFVLRVVLCLSFG